MARKKFVDVCTGVIKKAREASGIDSDEFSDGMIRDLVEDLAAIREQALKTNNFRGLKGDLLSAIKEKKFQADIRRRVAIDTLIKEKTQDSFMRGDDWKGRMDESIIALAEGKTSSITKGGNFGADPIKRSLQNRWWKFLEHGFENLKIGKLIGKDDSLQEDVFEALFQIDSPAKDFKGNPLARDAAEVINAVQNDIVEELRAAGIPVHKIKNFVIHDTHSPDKVGKVKFEVWEAAVRENYDLDILMKDTGDATAALKRMYDDISTGSYEQAQGVGPFTGNIAKRHNLHRKLIPKSGRHFFKYNKQFGRTNLIETLRHSMFKASREAGSARMFGANPEEGFNNAIARAKEWARENDKKSFKRLNSKIVQNRLKNVLLTMKGFTSRPGTSQQARFVSAVKRLRFAQLLGKAGLNSLGDIVTVASTVRTATGQNPIKAIADTNLNFIRTIANTKLRTEIAKDTAIAIQTSLGENYHRFLSEDMSPGMFVDSQQFISKYSGLTRVTDSGKTVFSYAATRDLGRQASKSRKKVSAHTDAAMDRFGIGELEWNLMRKNVGDIQGQPIIGAEAISELPATVIEKEMRKHGKITAKSKSGARKQVENFRRESTLRVMNYFSEQADVASPTTGAKQERQTRQGQDPDSYIGMFLNAASTFLGFPFAMANSAKTIILSNPRTRPKNLREAFSLEKKDQLLGEAQESSFPRLRGDMTGTMTMVAHGTVVGYGLLSINAMLNNKTAPDPTEPQVVLDSIIKAGFGGMWVDMILRDHSRADRDFISSLAGPVLADVNTAKEIISLALRGESRAASVSFEYALRQIPNLIFARDAANYLFIHELHEMARPGFLGRREARIRQTPALGGGFQEPLIGDSFT